MRNLKNAIATLGGFALALFVAGCADILQAPAAPEAKPGKATLSVSGGPARTVAPKIAQFEKIVLSIVDSDDPLDMREVPVDKNSGSVTVEFKEPGSWEITAKAYINAADPDPAAESEPHDFNWDAYDTEVSGETSFVLLPTAEAHDPGTLKYTITIPTGITLAGSGSSIKIEQEDAADLGLAGFTNNALDLTEGKTGTVNLPPGYYGVTILLVEDGTGETAIYWENVVILPGLFTELAFEPDAGDFLDPETRAALTDINEEDGEDNKLLVFGEPLSKTGAVTITPNFSNPASPVLAVAAPAGTGMVYFTLAKTAAHSVLVKEGDDSALVEHAENGTTVEGSEAGDALAVFTVDTASVAGTGGPVAFVLTIAKDGKTGVEVAVTITVAAPQTGNGPGLYINTGTVEAEILSQDVKDKNNNPAQNALGGYLTDLPDILAWLGANAVDDTKYVVLVNQDWGLDTGFLSSSPVGDLGVSMTLRGIGERRTIFWNSSNYPETGTSVNNAVFGIRGKTTLTLDDNIVIGSLNSGASFGYLFAVVAGAVLEMRGNSEISGTKAGYGVIRVGYGGAGDLKMYDHSVIKDNTYVNSNSTAIGFIHIQSGTFEMHGNASITGNKWEPYLSGTDTQIGNRIYVTGYAAVYGTGAISFKMHDNSEISGNEMRAVYLTSSGSNYPSFTMTGGAITNNGKKTWTGSNIEYYVLGGGIYLASGQFEMKGGTIADNGVSDRPGSGIMAYNTSNTTVTTPFILNGSVAITGNPIAFRAVNDTTNRTYPYLGPDFSASIPISVQLILNGSTNNDVNNYATYWKDKQFLIPLTGESTPDISTMANMFVIAGYYWLNTSAMNSADYSEQVNYKIDADGYIRANSDF